jgi:hypothetical protein
VTSIRTISKPRRIDATVTMKVSLLLAISVVVLLCVI